MPGRSPGSSTPENCRDRSCPTDPPLVGVFASFCSQLIERLELTDLVVAGRVTELAPGEPLTVTATNTTMSTTIRARRVVWTGNTALAVTPAALTPWIDARAVQHATDVDLRSIGSLAGEHVMIVGGGLTAGHLVVAALARSARVTLVTRRPIVERDFDVEPGWLGPRYLSGFWKAGSPQHRLDTARAARGGGSMPGWMRRRLRTEVRAGHLEHRIGPIEETTFDDDGGEVCVAGKPLRVDRCWLATGTRPDVRADRALAAHVDQDIDGVPVVDTDLRVGRSPVHVTGRLAMMELGPAAGNLWGARSAARRITRELTGVDLDTDAVTAIRPTAQAAGVGGAR